MKNILKTLMGAIIATILTACGNPAATPDATVYATIYKSIQTPSKSSLPIDCNPVACYNKNAVLELRCAGESKVGRYHA